jgi:hypothetical protein
MIIHVDASCAVQVKDSKDFKRFKVQVDAAATSFDKVRVGTAPAVTFESREVAWVSAKALFDLPSLRDDPEWKAELEAMIAKARPHGWIKEEPLSIKAHIEWAPA